LGKREDIQMLNKKFKNKIKNIDKGILTIVAIYILITPFLLTPWIHGNDAVGYYSYLRSFVIDHDLDLENEYEHYTQIFPEINVKVSQETGRVTNQYTIGTAIFWSPFFIITHLFAQGDGYGYPYVLAVTFASSLYVLIALIMIYLLLKEYFDKFVSTTTIILMLFSTHLLFYAFLQPSVSHAISMFSVTWFIYYWYKTKEKRTTKQWIILSIIGGLMSLTRHQNGLFLTIPLLESMINYYKYYKIKNIKNIIILFRKNFLFLILLIVIAIPQLVVWNYHNGSPFSGAESAGYEIAALFKPIHFFNVLFATHGLISWTPIIGFSLLGLLFFYKKDKELCLYLLLGLILQLYIVSTWKDWIGGQTFGQRRLLDCIIIYSLGLAALIDKIKKKVQTWIIVLIGVIFIIWNFGFLMQYGSGIIPSEGYVSYLEMIKNNFTKIPKKMIYIIKDFLINRRYFLR
jgi:hypothetical protein